LLKIDKQILLFELEQPPRLRGFGCLRGFTCSRSHPSWPAGAMALLATYYAEHQ
jgi:hypothetical protein